KIVVDDFKLEIARPMCLFFILNKKSYRRVCDLTPISKKYYRANFLFRKNTGIHLEDLLYSTVTDFLNADKK
ncbi:MAG: hypothetical protein LKI51_07815, partial [Lactobacillus delbrueckii]|nr:hypothetical protein [Lactobacillus delbrueckii]MCI1790491.1 hypothetical protein [Lactobacillus delbrueckii]